MLGWWYCGYIEQWAPAGKKQLGQQCGFFNPFGEPNEPLLSVVKQANENASLWHGGAFKNAPPPRVNAFESDTTVETPEPTTPAEMFAALERQRVAAEATFRDLRGDSLQDAKRCFYQDRKTKLREILTAKQWSTWSEFWDRPRSSTAP